MVHCTECGREQADMAKFCRYCGERMPGLDLVMKLKQEAAAIQRAKSGSRNPPQTLLIRNNLLTTLFALEGVWVALDSFVITSTKGHEASASCNDSVKFAFSSFQGTSP